MSVKQLIISTIMLFSPLYVMCRTASCSDSLGTILSCPKEIVTEDTIQLESFTDVSITMDSMKEDIISSRYLKRVERVHKRWMSLIPNKAISQFAGNIGMFSFGIGWDYSKKDQWETYLIAGYLPKRESRDDYWTFTLKEMYTPWSVKLYKDFTFQPFFATFMVNTIFSNEFWVKEPDRYPKGYYGFSSKVRFHIGIGEKVSFDVPNKNIRWFKRLSVYYEITTCDLYVRQKILNRSIPLRDIFCLGIGVQYKMFE